MSSSGDELTFWGHLDELRALLFRVLGVTLLFGVVAFTFKEQLYTIILAPKEWDFITYRLLSALSSLFLDTPIPIEKFSVQLINTGLAGQFVIHMKSSAYVAVLSVMPYILYQIFRFISPALYDNERRVGARVIVSSYVMFMVGVVITYFLIFPLTFRFLGTYQVSQEVVNTITIQSYIDTLATLAIAMGVVFEIPILSWLLARFGFINSDMMRTYRRHIAVAILIGAAIITPTTDIFTLLMVALPMYLLYEASILIVKVQRG